MKREYRKLRILDLSIRLDPADVGDEEEVGDESRTWTNSLFPALLDRFPSVESMRFAFPSLELYQGFEQIAKLRTFHIHCLEGTKRDDLEAMLIRIFSQETLNLQVLRITRENLKVDIPTDIAYWNGRLERRLPSSVRVVLS